MSELLEAYRENKGLIRGIIRRYLGRGADIDDLLQETFLRAFAAQMHTEVRHPKAFLLRIARNLSISEARKKVSTNSFSIEDFADSDVLNDDGAGSPEKRLSDRQRLTVLVEALAGLSPELQETFVMRKVDGLSFRQIATRLNVSVSTVEKRAALALVRIDAAVRARGYEPADYGDAVVRGPKPVQEKKV